MNRALVFSIEEFSVFDGPGIRTTIFLKGCPLRCTWCHNPEGQAFEQEIIKAQGCIGCGSCANGADPALCPKQLLRLCGTEYTPQTLVGALQENFPLLRQAGGGITFSGGEPLSHPEFLRECLSLLRGKIHTAVQTSGYSDPGVFESILPLTDYILFDLKLIDTVLHRNYTGVNNQPILLNFKHLASSHIPFTVRTPLIPGVTDTVQNLSAIAQILSENRLKQIELLPYNRAAGGKYASIGRSFSPNFDETKPISPHTEIFEAFGIQATIL